MSDPPLRPEYPLKDDRQERFAQLLSRGVPRRQAFWEAGYADYPSNALRVSRLKHVAARIRLLRDRRKRIGAKAIEKRQELAWSRLDQIYCAAIADEELNIARMAVVDMAKMDGVYADKVVSDITKNEITHIELVAGPIDDDKS